MEKKVETTIVGDLGIMYIYCCCCERLHEVGIQTLLAAHHHAKASRARKLLGLKRPNISKVRTALVQAGSHRENLGLKQIMLG